MPDLIILPPNTRCSRATCEQNVVKMAAGHKPFCSASCRVLTTTAESIVNARRVPRGKDHAADVSAIMRLFPAGRNAPVSLSRDDWSTLLALRDSYGRKRRGRDN